ncbi:MAG: GntR family transcriptional regulator [Sulfitobacter sp.]|nr:GntR family transcriptional regulator [Sulfitobacter sp.]
MSLPQRLTWTDVRDHIRGHILDRTYAPGDKLPRDADLARDLGCARTTVHRAMQDLSQDGLVERKRKGGTHVRARPVTRATFDIPIIRHEVEQKGGRYGYQLTRRDIAMPPPTVLAACEVTEPREMLHLEALHLADGRPYIFEDRWIDLKTVPEIAQVDLARQSANEWLVLNRPYTRCDVRLYAISASADLARLLDCGPDSGLLVIERSTWITDAAITTVKAIAAPGYQLLAAS